MSKEPTTYMDALAIAVIVPFLAWQLSVVTAFLWWLSSEVITMLIS